MRGPSTAISLVLLAAACGGRADEHDKSPDYIAEEACEALKTLWSMLPEECRPSYEHGKCLDDPRLEACGSLELQSVECLIQESIPHCTDDGWDFTLPGGACIDEGEAAASCRCEQLGLGCD